MKNLFTYNVLPVQPQQLDPHQEDMLNAERSNYVNKDIVE